ncbi:hypothetical protein BaRGS_00008520 [Batillaria attramentaria]|uniref:C2H2-type domain-containing protein n=1 Tax=Batillaria attramentaria TaxID=370345 RepID=A0ABD0LL71_9CAEN
MIETREEEEAGPSSKMLVPKEVSPPDATGKGEDRSASGEGDNASVETPKDQSLNSAYSAQGSGSSSSRSDGNRTSPVFRCETCNAVFDSLDHFMDHRNFVCVADAGAVWTSEDKADWSGSDSRSSFSPSVEDGIGSPLPIHLSEDQLPYTIGINETNPYGCQYCEKAFPRLSFLRVHERVHGDQLPFRCLHCQRMFRHKRSRDRHMKLHASDRKFSCHLCDSTFSRNDQLKLHLQSHNSSKLYQCPICQASYSSAAALTAHLTSHQGRNGSSGSLGTSEGRELPCLHCGQSFTSAHLLREHMVMHAAAIKEEKLSCDICSEAFTSQEALDSHMERSHYGNHPMDVDAAMMLKCPMCPHSFPDTLTLCHHLMTHTATGLTSASDLDLQVLTRGEGKDIVEVSPGRKEGSRSHTPKQSSSSTNLSPSSGSGMSKSSQALVCPYCLSDSFDTLEVLELHMQSVHSVKSSEIYTCNYCNAPYPNLYSLHDHMNVVHRNHPGIGIKYPCSLCNNQFPSIEALAKHKSLSHSYPDNSESNGRASGIDSAFCGQCSQTFSDARQLEDHMVCVHGASVEKKSAKQRGRKSASKGNKENKASSSKNKTSTATRCNATFHELGNFQAHMKLHLDAALAKFTCKKCGQQLGSQEQLEAHLSLHYLCLATEYGCTSCMKLFSKPDELQKHLMDIHAHHLYRCALCKEIFDSKVNIQVHFAIKHSNECKLFKCTQCSNIFRSEMEWQVHVRVNHLHLAKPYRCLFCAESFTSEMELQCHLTTHSKPFRCPMCEQAFHIEYLLDKHMQTEHADMDTKSATLNTSTSPALATISIKEEADSSLTLQQMTSMISPRPSSHSSDTLKSLSPAIPQPAASPQSAVAVWKNSEAIHVCNICDSRFTQQALLTIHKAQEHGLRSVGLGAPSSLSPQGKGRGTSASPSASAPPAHSQSPREKFLQQNQTLVSVLTADSSATMSCAFCSQTFRNQVECDKHMKIHANSTSLKCNICDETFPSSATLAEHKLQHCKIQQGNICFVCKLSLKTEEQFYTHAQEHGYQIFCKTLGGFVAAVHRVSSDVGVGRGATDARQAPLPARPSFYTCCVCLKTFDSKENLVSKLNASGRTYYVCKPCYHGESPLYTCPQCSEKFASRAQLEAHVATHTSPSATSLSLSTASSLSTMSTAASGAAQTYQCIKCQEAFSTEYEIQLHVANHMLQEGVTHECKLCTLVFDSPAKLQCHLIEHTFKHEAEMRCSVCGRVFSTASEIQAHALEHGVTGRQHTCGQCSQRFFFSAELDNHVLIYNHSPALSPLDSPQRYECRECSKVFTSATALANHRKTHERRETSIKCTLCTQTFTSVPLMQQHFLTAHAGITVDSGHGDTSSKSHKCSQCKQQFATQDGLQAHMKTHKTGNNKLSCPMCSKTFSQARNLTLHLRSHTGDKPHQCSVCQKRFSREENMKAHMKSHTGPSTQPLVCPLCDQSFSQKSDITQHLKTHFVNTEQENSTLMQQALQNSSSASSEPNTTPHVNTAKSPTLNSTSQPPDVNGSQSDGSDESSLSTNQEHQVAAEVEHTHDIKTEIAT